MSIRAAIELVRRLGPRWVLFRAGYALRGKTGLLRRRFPVRPWEAVNLRDVLRPGALAMSREHQDRRETGLGKFLFPPGILPEQTLLQRLTAPSGTERTRAVADDYCRGRFLYYSRHVFDLGWPPDWLLNPFTGGQHEVRTHWCDYPTFSPALGDIKDVWEPSRFAAAFWLVRAYALTRDEKYPRGFWELFESWQRQNPPNLGPNWKCGQETALRTMAWCFALFAFWKSPATTPVRVGEMLKAIALQAERIAGNVDFAVSQKNNHGLSEATGLLTVGLLFPELRGARRWEALGRRVLEQEVRRQIYEDGSYVQQSMNYHRVMLHVCLWAIRLAEMNGRPLSAELRTRVAKAGEFLHEMLDLPSGRVPNYGANDGALVLPLSSCDYTDYRPTVQAARYQTTGRLMLAPGPWDETVLWLFGGVASRRTSGPSAVSFAPVINRCHTGKMPVPHDAAFTGKMLVPQREGEAPAEPAHHSAGPPTSRRFDAGGYYTLRSGDTWCMIRCHTYRDRPAHVDMLHVDLWHRGVNVLGDSGTYKYYVTDNPALERYFKDIRAHNTIEIDETGPLELVSRFVWLPWPRARCLALRADSWQGEHYAYHRVPWRVVHRRTVERIEPAVWEISDELSGSGRHQVTLRWHLPDGVVQVDAAGLRVAVDLPCGLTTLSIQGPGGLRLQVLRGAEDADRVSGWESAYYGARAPRLTVEAAGACELPARIVTRLALGKGVGT